MNCWNHVKNGVCGLTCVSFQTEDLSVAFRRLKASGRERDKKTRGLSRIFGFQKNILRTQQSRNVSKESMKEIRTN